jgi:hypothetical protein
MAGVALMALAANIDAAAADAGFEHLPQKHHSSRSFVGQTHT